MKKMLDIIKLILSAMCCIFACKQLDNNFSLSIYWIFVALYWYGNYIQGKGVK